ncbi:hypothetical protein SLEP1_g47275 [Rubroshorea leprosula]|uniref:Uncharacterized protein n=1 Tax=Rubroshorea leprosula TaxID=152421 RepID=A0AAV5LSK2_9ROSI|nr:hypothetical protein SLEP1_g47275 [Rubroshorea leprosula]
MSPYRIVYGKACTRRKLQISEIEELRNNAYDNSRIYKTKLKATLASRS